MPATGNAISGRAGLTTSDPGGWGGSSLQLPTRRPAGNRLLADFPLLPFPGGGGVVLLHHRGSDHRTFGPQLSVLHWYPPPGGLATAPFLGCFRVPFPPMRNPAALPCPELYRVGSIPGSWVVSPLRSLAGPRLHIGMAIRGPPPLPPPTAVRRSSVLRSHMPHLPIGRGGRRPGRAAAGRRTRTRRDRRP